MNIRGQFTINRPVRLTAYSLSTGNALYCIRELEDLSLKVTSEDNTVTDAMGSPIAIFEKAKQGEVSGSASLVNFGLASAQFGSDAKAASASEKLIMPRIDELEIKAGKVTLTKTPIADSVTSISVVNTDGTFGDYYMVAATASEKEFSITGKEITVPTSLTKGTIAVTYDYETTTGLVLENNATEYTKPCRILIEVLGSDVCTPDLEKWIMIESKNAKPDSNVELALKSDAKHPFTYKIMPQYCDKKKNIFTIYAPEE